MSENKKINIEIIERETTLLKSDNEVKDISSEADLNIINTSEENKIWNLALKIENNDFTDLKKEDKKESLDKNGIWNIKYKVTNLKAPILNVSEIIDTSVEKEGVNNNFVKATKDKASITIELKNVSEKSISNINVEKLIPDFLKQIEVKASGGNADYNLETHELKWSVPELAPNNSVKVTILATTDLKDSEPKSLNEVKVRYESEDNYRSQIVPHIEANTNTMSGIDQEEDDSEPGKWNCVLEFENESDLELTLRKAQVTQKTPAKEELVVDANPNEVIAPNGEWSYPFSVYDKKVPELKSEIDFTVNYYITKKIIGEITKDATILNVLSTKVEKEIEPPVVKANANTDMVIKNIIINTGSANIDKCNIIDKIPRDFEPPSIEEIKFDVLDEYGAKIKTLGNEHLAIEIDPNDKETTKEHTIMAEVTKLNDIFKPKGKLIMQYPLIARNPQTGRKYETPVEVVSNTKPECAGYKDNPEQLPEIGIKFIQRKVKTMKSISPAGEGAYDVVIKISNKGGVEIEKITVVEELPKGFVATNVKPQDILKHSENEGIVTLEWYIGRLNAEESIKLKYTAEGSGEFVRIEPKVMVAEPDSIKSGDEAAETETKKTEKVASDGFSKLIEDIWDKVIKKVKEGISYEQAAKLMEDAKEQILERGKSAVAIHNIAAEIRELAKNGSKMILGDEINKVIDTIENWKKNLL
ncbi:MAG: hypothetical protein ACTSU2_03095 [Promethearchaeota archaeon]